MYNIGDKITIDSRWDWMEYWAEEAYEDGTIFKVLDVDRETSEVCIEYYYFDDVIDDTIEDTAWVSYDYIKKWYRTPPFELSEHDKKYYDVVYKIKSIQLKRKETGYVF